MRDAPARQIPRARAGWLVGPGFDLPWLIAPGLLGAAVALALPDGTRLPTWGWVLLVVGVDVSHVYATLYRTWLDPETRAHRPGLLWGCLGAAAVGCGLAQGLAPGWFWTGMAYLAVFHFARQAVGLGVLLRARAGLPTRDPAGRLARAASYAVTFGPVVWWHAHLPLDFEWFAPDDFVGPWPEALGTAALALTAAVVGLHGLERLRSRRAAPAADLWLLSTAAAWFGGIVLSASDAGFTASNVVAHGVPYVALVWWVGRRRWALEGRGPAVPWMFEPVGAALAVGLLVALAVAEEGLWDALVWHEHGPWTDWEPSATVRWAAVALLSVPQVTHYLLDGFLWKLGPANPGLGAALGLPVTAPAPAASPAPPPP